MYMICRSSSEKCGITVVLGVGCKLWDLGKYRISLPRGICDPLYPLGKASAFVKTWKCPGQSPRHFLGFTQALVFHKGYNGSYIPLGRDVLYLHVIPCLGYSDPEQGSLTR